MRVLVSGARGLVGTALTAVLRSGGHEVVALGRRPGGPGTIVWDPIAGRLAARDLEGFDAVVHLAGEPIAGRWTAARREAIRASRVEGTRLLSARLAELLRPPRVLVSVSAIGIYGDRGEESLDETSPPGTGFLADVCREWEAATAPAAARGIRVVMPRLGLVLAPGGGALARLLPAFRLGLGGPLGRGRAWWSWVALDDVVAVLERAARDEALAGPINLTAPHPVRNGEFARTLGRVLGRPARLPVPPPLLRVAFGEMARETLLAGARVHPARLLAAGHVFRFPELEGALRHLLGRSGPGSRNGS